MRFQIGRPRPVGTYQNFQPAVVASPSVLLPPFLYLLLLSPGLLGWTAGFPTRSWFLEAGDQIELPAATSGSRSPLLAPLLAPLVGLLQCESE